MYRISRSSILFAFLFVMVFAMARPGSAEVNALWTVSSISGSASITESGQDSTRPLGPDEMLKTGDRIETGEDGRIVVKRGEQSVVVTSNSSFEIIATESTLLTRIYQSFGTLMFQVDKRPEKHFQVDTPYLHAVVKGTTFTVNVDEGGANVHVTSGTVEVTEPFEHQKILVGRGYTASIGSSYGSSLMIGVIPDNGRPEHGPKIKSDLGTGKLDIEQASKGLLHDQQARKHGANRKKNDPSTGRDDVYGADSTDGMVRKSHGNGKSRRSKRNKKHGK